VLTFLLTSALVQLSTSPLAAGSPMACHTPAGRFIGAKLTVLLGSQPYQSNSQRMFYSSIRLTYVNNLNCGHFWSKNDESVAFKIQKTWIWTEKVIHEENDGLPQVSCWMCRKRNIYKKRKHCTVKNELNKHLGVREGKNCF